jgi:predicted dehydrogenase
VYNELVTADSRNGDGPSTGGTYMPELLHIGLWGCGNMGSSLAQGLVATEQAQLAIVYDILPGAASGIAGLYGTYAVGSAQALLAYPRLDGVIIALPPYLHAAAAIQAAEAGLNVFVEKPMALTVSDCQRMVQAAHDRGVELMVGQVLRYYEPYRSILRWRDEGRFGEIHAASIWRTTPGAKWAGEGNWRASRAKSGGFLAEVAVHELDMLRCLLGKPKTVYASELHFMPWSHEMEDYVAVHIRFHAGDASFEGGGGTYVGRYGFRLYFDGATILSDSAFEPQALQVLDPQGESLQAVHDEFSVDNPVQEELRDWLAAVRGERLVPIPGEEGLANVALVEAAYRSARLHQTVSYDIQVPTLRKGGTD